MPPRQHFQPAAFGFDVFAIFSQLIFADTPLRCRFAILCRQLPIAAFMIADSAFRQPITLDFQLADVPPSHASFSHSRFSRRHAEMPTTLPPRHFRFRGHYFRRLPPYAS